MYKVQKPKSLTVEVNIATRYKVYTHNMSVGWTEYTDASNDYQQCCINYKCTINARKSAHHDTRHTQHAPLNTENIHVRLICCHHSAAAATTRVLQQQELRDISENFWRGNKWLWEMMDVVCAVSGRYNEQQV